MTRMLLSLDEQDKAWLQRQAQELGVSMAEVVRSAIQMQRSQQEAALRRALDQTRGIWKQGDGLRYQQKLRAEWDRQ